MFKHKVSFDKKMLSNREIVKDKEVFNYSVEISKRLNNCTNCFYNYSL